MRNHANSSGARTRSRLLALALAALALALVSNAVVIPAAHAGGAAGGIGGERR